MNANPQSNTTTTQTQGVAQPNPNGRNSKYVPNLGATVSKAQVAKIKPINSPDPVLAGKIQSKLQGKGKTERKRQEAGDLLLDWMQDNGLFLQDEEGEGYYLFSKERQLYNLNSSRFLAWLFALSGSNPASRDFAYLLADCRTAAMFSEKRSVYRVAAWDSDNQVLRVSRFDGSVYVLDGVTIIEEGNGEGAIFDDNPAWQPYKPDFLAPQTFKDINAYFDAKDNQDKKKFVLGMWIWILTLFLIDFCPTRPFMVLLGEKGSGKSMILRVIMRLIFGPRVELSGTPDKIDDFCAATSSCFVYPVDNLDDFCDWLRDRIARLSTGAQDDYRRLYTNKEVGHFRYRCWLVFTSRSPETLRRDDLADRMIPFPVVRIPEFQTIAERQLLEETDKKRNFWWGDALELLNTTVAAIRNGELTNQSTLRMADWESLGRMIARVNGEEQTWEEFITWVKQFQEDFILESNDLLIEGLDKWIAYPKKDPTTQAIICYPNRGRDITTRELYNETTNLLFSGKPAIDWPKSAVSFGKRLAYVRRELQRHLKSEKIKMTWTTGRGRKVTYCFEVIP